MPSSVLTPKKNTALRPRYTSLSEEIRQMLLDEFIRGQLPPGTAINDTELSKKLGVSRTPVREALRGLQELGIIETLPARVTRVVQLTAKEFAHVTGVWSSLYCELLTDIIDRVTESDVNALVPLCSGLDGSAEDNPATVTFHFFERLASLTNNRFLRNIIHTAACRMRLGYVAHGENARVTHFEIGTDDARTLLQAILDRDLHGANQTLSQMLRRSGDDATSPSTAESVA